MKKIFTTLVLACLVLTAMAVPAKPGQWRTLKLADGTTVRAELFGDERMHYYVGEDKTLYVQSGEVYKQIGTKDLHDRIATAQKAFMAEAAETGGLRLSPRHNGVQKARTRAGEEEDDYVSPYTGTKKSLIILVQFSDMKFSIDDDASHTQAQQDSVANAFYTRMANTTGFSERNFNGSLNDYFMAQSNGQFNLQFDIAGPYTLGNNYAYYGANTSDGNIDVQKAQMMISQACATAAQNGVDFTQYDWDGDGEVEEVYVIYAGQGEADGGDENTVWPHKYQLASSTLYGGAYVDVYACSNEVNGSGQTAGIGTICHEFSHCLGYPDMYDTDYSTNGNQYGMGSWDLMCSGSYNGNGYTPAGYTAFEKAVAGWIEPVDLSDSAKVSVSDWKAIKDGGEAYIMYNPGSDDEFYIWENRQPADNETLPGSGIMIHHIDYDPYVWAYNCPNTIGDSYYDANNELQTNSHERITFFAADNDRSTNSESRDCYPYGTNNALTNGSSPAGTVFNTNDSTGTLYMNVNITNMAVNSGLASFSFVNMNLSHGNSEGNAFYESFDKCAGTGGNDGRFASSGMTSLATATFTPDNDGWSTGNAFGGNMCARFGNTSGGRFSTNVTPGVATSPTFTLDGTVTLSFKAAPYGNDGTALTVSVSGGTLSQTSFTMTAGEWTDFTTTLTGTGEVTLTFSGEGRFFLDEVTVPNPSGGTGISEVRSEELRVRNSDSNLYNIAGQRVDENYHGIVIQNGKKRVQK